MQFLSEVSQTMLYPPDLHFSNRIVEKSVKKLPAVRELGAMADKVFESK
jgi:hypothetical protein